MREVVEKSKDLVEETLELPAQFALHYGDSLPGAKVAFRVVGPKDAPVVIVLGGISAHRIVSDSAEGWWPEMVGANLGVDTKRYRVLGMDYIGGGGLWFTPPG